MQVRRCRGDRIDPPSLYALLRLRQDVFVVEQACPYLDLDGRDLEVGTLHLWVEDGSGPQATVRILSEPDGTRRVGRVATRADTRGRGLARDLIRAALSELGPVETVLAAQSHLRRYYEGLGYTVDGPEFTEDGIPHLPMRRPAPTTAVGSGSDGDDRAGPG